MTRRPLLLAVPLAAAALLACGSEDIQLAENDPLYGAAVIFNQRCSACHTFKPAGGEGSAVKPNSRERKDGPNLNVRRVEYEEALYAIRNGGFSSGPMPQNLVVGKEAEAVACFVASYSGRERVQANVPGAEEVKRELDPCVQQLGGE